MCVCVKEPTSQKKTKALTWYAHPASGILGQIVSNKCNRARLKGEVKVLQVSEGATPRASTRETWPAAPLQCISHNVFGVDLMAIKNNVLVVVLFVMPLYPRDYDWERNAVLRENRVKRSAGCGCIVGRSSCILV